jgi:predicted dehydrogenase
MTTDDKPVRWGVLSTSAFAAKKFIPGARLAPGVEIVAVASRSVDAARDYAATNDIGVAYGSYEELIADPSIQVIYNPLPNTLHVEWTLRAALAGKHVLCEKPMAMNAAELERLRPVADRVHIAEAFMVRLHPQWIEVRNRVRSGELGDLTHAHMAFAYTNADPSNIRNIAAVGGGALYDIGCYCVAAARWFFDAEPVRALALFDRDPNFRTDRRTTGLLDLGAGRHVAFSCATQSVPHQRVHLYGTAGRIEITIPFNQPEDEPCVYFTHDGASLHGIDQTRHEVPTANQYTLEAAWFSDLVRDHRPSAALLDQAVQQAKVLDALFRSESSGQLENV